MIDFNLLTLEKIAENKTSAERTAKENLESFLKNEEVKKAYKESKRIAFELSRKEFLKEDVSDLEKQFEESKKNFKIAIKNIGGNLSDIKPNYSCKICNDTGYNGNKKCECFNKIKNEILLENAGFSKMNLPTFATSNFEVFKEEKTKEKAKKLYELLQKFVDKLTTSKIKTILITGLVGVGKTHLLECVVSEAVSKNYFVNYTTAFNFNQEMLEYHLADLKDKKVIMDKYLNCDLLCIDDLGTENILKNVTVEYLYLILSERLNKGKPIIITTNLNLEQIEKVYDDRILSRLTHKLTGLLINFEGEDLRNSR